jgi:tetratricopeptide (TPR) repeat protein
MSKKTIMSLGLTFLILLGFGWKILEKSSALKVLVRNYASQELTYCLADYPTECKNHKIKRLFSVLKNNTANNPDLMGLVAYCGFQIGDIKASIKLYEQALQSWPDFFWFHYNLGIIYYEMKDYNKSLLSFQKAIASDIKTSASVSMTSKLHGTTTVLRLSKEKRPLVDVFGEAKQNLSILTALDYYYLKQWSKLQEHSELILSGAQKDKNFFWCFEGLAAQEMKEETRAIYALRNCQAYDENLIEPYETLALIFDNIGKKQEAYIFNQKAKTLKTMPHHSIFDTSGIHLAVF